MRNLSQRTSRTQLKKRNPQETTGIFRIAIRRMVKMVRSRSSTQVSQRYHSTPTSRIPRADENTRYHHPCQGHLTVRSLRSLVKGHSMPLFHSAALLTRNLRVFSPQRRRDIEPKALYTNDVVFKYFNDRTSSPGCYRITPANLRCQ